MASDSARAHVALAMSTIAFAVCTACWLMNGVLVAFFVENNLYSIDTVQVGWLLGAPILVGAVLRLPAGMMTDRLGGRAVLAALMLVSAIPAYLMSHADSFQQLLLASLGFGMAGASFAVGVAYTSLWFPRAKQGTALGVFGMGTLGAALTTLGAPRILDLLTNYGETLDGWRLLPKIYAGALVLTAVAFYMFTETKTVEHGKQQGLMARLSPLAIPRVWRFGLYYAFLFGGFIALAQWMIPYYVNTYAMSVAVAGTMATAFNLPSALFRAVGGWASDRWGARVVTYRVFGASIVCCLLLAVPRMDVVSPGEGVQALRSGIVTSVSPSSIEVNGTRYELAPPPVNGTVFERDDMLVLPSMMSWDEPIVSVGDHVGESALLARGVTHIYFQANIWIFSGLLMILGIAMGIGMGAVFKYIPEYFPTNVGVVGGMVGVIGGVGGFMWPILFGHLLKATGIWTTCWMALFAIVLAAAIWLHLTVRKMMSAQAPALARQIEDRPREEATALAKV